MAGPRKKQGLDYFPHDVDLSTDEKIQLIEAEHGLTGYAVYVKLLERIYRNGYFIQADDKYMKLLSKSLSIDFNLCKNIITSCTQEKLFDGKLFKNYSILTSKGIQIRYLEAASRRQQIEFIKEYCLLNGNNFRDNVNIISINVSSNAHRIGEDRIGEDRKEDNENTLSCSEPESNSEQKPIFTIPLLPKYGEFPVFGKDIEEWKKDFPGIDVEKELHTCRSWNKSNPTRRKTKTGILRHINTWLTKAQNKAKGSPDDYKRRFLESDS